MKKIFILLLLIPSIAFANSGWYSTLQGTASDVQQSPPPNGVTIAYNTTDHEWEFNYGLAPAGGTTGTCLEKNSNSDYDYSWVSCSGGGAGSVTSVTLATPNSTLTLGGTNPVTTSGTINADINLGNSNTWTGQQIFTTTNVGIGSTNPGKTLDVNGTVRSTGFTLTGNGAGNGNILVGNNIGIGTWMNANTIPTSIILTTTGSSGASSLTGNILNIPQYSGGAGSNYWTLSTGLGNVGLSTTNTVGIGTWMGSAYLSVIGGNVGIGTWNPVNLFQAGSGNKPGLLVLSNGNIDIGTNVAGSTLVTIGPSASNQVTIDNTANIITTGYIEGQNITGFLQVSDPGYFGGGNGASGSGAVFEGRGNGGASYVELRASAYSTSQNDLVKVTGGFNGATRFLTVLDSPNSQWGIGIGTVSPGGILDVFSTIRPVIFQAQKTTSNPQNVGIGTYLPLGMLDVEGTVSPIIFNANQNVNTNVGIGTTAPIAPLQVVGNSVFNSSSYAQFNTSTFTPGTGGTITTYFDGTYWHYVHTFTSNGTFTAPNSSLNAQLLVVAGGGSGGGYGPGSGGGAGGLIYNSSYAISANQGTSVTVGGGGTGVTTNAGNNGSDSIFGSQDAVGGAGGVGNEAGNGLTGGSGSGGGYNTTTGGLGTAGQGNNGGNGISGGSDYQVGGGGGCGSVGVTATTNQSGAGGSGCSKSITGTAVVYACGGGGAGRTSSGGNPGAAGCSSAGAGGSSSVSGGSATANFGGGGGGQGMSGTSGAGGSGVVIVAYQAPLGFNPYSSAPVLYANGGLLVNTTTNNGVVSVRGAGNTSSSASISATNSSSNTTFIVLDSGNVGISSTTPGQQLDVGGTVRIYGQLLVGVNNSQVGQVSCIGTGNCVGACTGTITLIGGACSACTCLHN